MTNRLLLLGLLALLAKTEGLRTSLQDYPFKMALNSDPSYEVHWEVDLEKEEVRFAVNASSRGWVGFGLSRTGQMIGSDVVIGWQDEKGEFQMQVRYFSHCSCLAILLIVIMTMMYSIFWAVARLRASKIPHKIQYIAPSPTPQSP